MRNKLTIHNNILFENIRSLIQEAQQHVVRNINSTMLMTYFQIGKIIVEHEHLAVPDVPQGIWNDR